MTYLDKITAYTNSLTAEDKEKVAAAIYSEIENTSKRLERQIEFLHYQKQTIRMCTTFTELLDKYLYLFELNPEEIETLKEIDLLGILNLDYENIESLDINLELKKRIVINSIYKQWINDFTGNSDNLETIIKKKNAVIALIDNSSTDQSLKNNLSNLIKTNNLDASTFTEILNRIKTELDIIYKITDSNYTFEKITKLLVSGEKLVEKILLGNNRQNYYDLWISARAVEQNKNEFLGVVDKISLINLTDVSNKELVGVKFKEITEDKRFEIIQEEKSVKLSSESKKIIIDKLSGLLNLVNNDYELLKILFSIFTNLNSDEIKILENLAGLISYYKTKINQPVIEGISSFDELNFNEYNNLLNTFISENEDSTVKFTDINIAFMDLLKYLERTNKLELISIFKNIQITLNKIYTDGIDVFINSNENRSIINIFESLGKDIIDLISDACVENFDNLINLNNPAELNSEKILTGILTRIENRNTVKYRTILSLQNLSDKEFGEIKKTRNEKLISIIKRSYKLLDEPNDHQGFIASLIEILTSNKILDKFDLQDVDPLIDYSESNFSNLENKLKMIVDEILDKYKKFVDDLAGKGARKNFKATEIEKFGSETEDAYMAFKKLLALIQFCGFCLSSKEINLFVYEFKSEILKSYLAGWAYSM